MSRSSRNIRYYMLGLEQNILLDQYKFAIFHHLCIVEPEFRLDAAQCVRTYLTWGHGLLPRELHSREVCWDLPGRVWHTRGYMECRDEVELELIVEINEPFLTVSVYNVLQINYIFLSLQIYVMLLRKLLGKLSMVFSHISSRGYIKCG